MELMGLITSNQILQFMINTHNITEHIILL